MSKKKTIDLVGVKAEKSLSSANAKIADATEISEEINDLSERQAGMLADAQEEISDAYETLDEKESRKE